MSATRAVLVRWFDEGVRQGATHMIVACDTFSHDNYAVYVTAGQQVREVAAEHDGPNMTKVDEVYCLGLDRDAQMSEDRALHYEDAARST